MSDDGSSALVGYSGFVGGNLLRQRAFDACFNSSNIEAIAGRSFDLLVCAGAPAEKWKANADPAADLANIERLIRALGQAEASKVVLLSTVDVFVDPVAVDEESMTHIAGLHAYGRNRRLLEEVVASRFDTTIVRLPGLYGHGIKKNAIYDLLNDNNVRKIDSRGAFQFYNLARLWSDIEIALNAELPVVHLATPPVSVTEVARVAFGMEFSNEIVSQPARYDMRTRHADLFGGHGYYIEDTRDELASIAEFVTRERALRG
jgi:nucleoside-diphosphate-sugar epimerase